MTKYSLLLLICFLLLVGCNYPGGQEPQSDLSVDHLRQTLAANSLPTELSTAIIEPTQTTTPVNNEVEIIPTSSMTSISPLPTTILESNEQELRYRVHSGDTLKALASRFDVEPAQIRSDTPIPAEGFITLGQELIIPNQFMGFISLPPVLPDSEVVNSPTAAGFNTRTYLSGANGYLSSYRAKVGDLNLTGADIVELVSQEASINPVLLLALLEFRSGLVFGQPRDASVFKYPLGFNVLGWEGLHKELVIAATHLNTGYYGWREGRTTEIVFRDGKKERINPEMNAGSVAVQTLMGKLYSQQEWQQVLYGTEGLIETHQKMFGDPWARAKLVEPLFPDGVGQPAIEFPFAPGQRWSLTGGPHASWKTGSPRGALDIAPVTGEADCSVSYQWVTAPAGGVITRSLRNVVALDLDGDGYEQTGWVIIFLHIADQDRIQTGVFVNLDDPIGHPSCEGGTSTGTHVHIARKFNGEWIAAYGPLPMFLSGWEVQAGEKDYQGSLIKNGQSIIASPVGPRTSIIVR